MYKEVMEWRNKHEVNQTQIIDSGYCTYYIDAFVICMPMAPHHLFNFSPCGKIGWHNVFKCNGTSLILNYT